MRTRTSLVILTMLTLLLAGCGNSQDKTVINYCKALESGKVDEAASYLSKEALQELERIGGKSVLAASGEAFKQQKGIKKITIVKSQVNGDKATVDFVYNFNDGSKLPDNFPLVKEDGKWKISK